MSTLETVTPEYVTDYLHDGTVIVTDRTEPDARFIVWQDESADDPRTWTDAAQTLIYRAAYLSRSEDDLSDADTGTMQTFCRVYDATGNEDHALKVAQRYARIVEPGTQIALHGARGYSQGAWWDTVTVTTDGTDPDAYAETLAQYLAGDVWCVKRETYVPCEVEGCHADDDEHWEGVTASGVDSLVVGGIYASDVEDAVSQYVAMGE